MQNKKTKRKAKKSRKPKVYIPPYKIIILCSIVIIICMALLLVTTIKSSENPQNSSIQNRYQQTELSQNENSSGKKNETSAKSQRKSDKQKKKKETQKKVESEKQNQKKTESSKSEKNKTKKSSETAKTVNTEKIGKTEKKEDQAVSKNDKTENQISAKPEKPEKKESPKDESQNSDKTETKSSVKSEKPKQTESGSKTSDKSKNQNSTKSTKSTNQDSVKSENKKTLENQNKKIPETSKAQESENQKVPINPDNSKPKDKFNFPQAKNHAQIIFVFDDGGQNLSHLEPFLNLPIPITIAVLPRLSHSVESAQKIRKSGKELILHQPMQALNSKVNPGPGAITPQMTEDEIIATLFYNINEIGPVAGMNNHEGSAITADAEKMAVILKLANEEGIYFLDSRTNSETKVPYVANLMGYSYYERNIFLDNEKTKENALQELKKGLEIANKKGSVIMIGHIWSAAFLPDFLLEVIPELQEKGYTFSTVSASTAQKF